MEECSVEVSSGSIVVEVSLGKTLFFFFPLEAISLKSKGCDVFKSVVGG